MCPVFEMQGGLDLKTTKVEARGHQTGLTGIKAGLSGSGKDRGAMMGKGGVAFEGKPLASPVLRDTALGVSKLRAGHL